VPKAARKPVKNPSKTRETPAEKKAWAAKVVAKLAELYPDAHCELDFAGPFQLLCAVILSAQCTDKTINKVTPGLFEKYPTPTTLAAADPAELEVIIRPSGFYRNKAKSLLSMSADVAGKFGGNVPGTMDELLTLHGVGRKTANVILGECFDTPGVVTDTHVLRLSERIGLSKQKDPVKLEHELMELIERKDWTLFSHRMIRHGRRVCNARKPECRRCGLAELCRFERKAEAPEDV
jgi:endonuclease-3